MSLHPMLKHRVSSTGTTQENVLPRRSSRQLVSRQAETGVDMRPYLPTSPANFETAILKDTEWYGSLYDRIKARFGAWLGEGLGRSSSSTTRTAIT